MDNDNTADEKIDFIVTVIEHLAGVIKDPTDSGNKKDMSAESRNEARSTAHDELLTCVGVLASCASFYHGYYEVVNIAQRLQLHDEATPK